MLRTISFFLLVWLSLLLSIVLLIPLPVLYFKKLTRVRKKYVWFCAHNWSRFALYLAGAEIKVEDADHIPKALPFVILSNHQGFMDIPVLLAVFPYTLSFVAKKELYRIPFINLWLLAQECLIINRSKPFRAHRKMEERLQKKQANPLVIFPEGTRSRSEKENKRKKAGIQLVQKSGIPIVYVQINGSYKSFEKEGRIKPALINVKISRTYERIKPDTS